MTDTELYRQLLGLTGPWKVARVDLNVAAQEVQVFVEHDFSQPQLVCPECQQAGPYYDLREERRWRHLDSCQFKTFLVARLPRIECPTHGVKTVSASWCEPHSRFTLAFECFAIAVLLATGVQSRAAQLLRLSPTQLHEVMARAVQRGLLRRDQSTVLRELSLDEKSFHQGHSYITVLGDSQGKRILDVIESRTLEATKELLWNSLSPSQRDQVQCVSMDMWPAFASAKDQVLPQAQTVHDRFHIAQYLSEAVDKTRRDEHRTLTKSGDNTLSKSKWLWLRSPENLTDKQRALFEALHSQELETAKVWSFKEAFREFFTARSVVEGEAFFANWYEQALSVGNKHLTQVAHMLQSHLEGLLAYLQYHTTNSVAECLNGQIQLIKARARGFRQFPNFRIAILFFLGKHPAVSGIEMLVAPDSKPHLPGHPLPPNAPRSQEAFRMREALATAEGKARYALRQTTVEPVFGQIKEARGIRRFRLRGLLNVTSEWKLICATHNLLKLFRHRMTLAHA